MNNPNFVSTAPWFKHRWPWFLMAGPGIVVVAGFITLALAIKSADGLVADDFYKQGKAINKTITRDARATELGLVAQIDLTATGKIALNFTGTQPDTERLRLKLHHPTRAGFDREILLARGSDGHYAAAMQSINTNRWAVTLEDELKTWRLTGAWRAGDQTVKLTSSR